MAIVSPLSKINETEGDEDSDVDDESDGEHEFPLRLERAALGTLKSRGQQLHENYDDQRPIEDEINEWAIEHEINLDKDNLLAAAKIAKSMLDYGLEQGVFSDEFVQGWADRCLGAYSRISRCSVVRSGDEGKSADSMLGTIKRNPDFPHVLDWADRCFIMYATY
jgi:hypothetical protein